jgi:hypothetical protein
MRYFYKRIENYLLFVTIGIIYFLSSSYNIGISIAGFNVHFIDITIIIPTIFWLIILSLRKEPLKRSILICALILFFIFFLSILVGVINGNDLNLILRESRIMLYVIFFMLMFSLIIKKYGYEDFILSLAYIFAICNILVLLSLVLTQFFPWMEQAMFNHMIKLAQEQIGIGRFIIGGADLLSAISIPIIVLVLKVKHSFSVKILLQLGLLTGFMIILISFTRVLIAASVIVTLWIFVRRFNLKSTLHAFFSFFVILMIMNYVLYNFYDFDTYNAFQKRFSGDGAVGGGMGLDIRNAENGAALAKYYKNSILLGCGSGCEFLDPNTGSYTPWIHNGFIWLLLNFGLFGLLLLSSLGLIVNKMRRPLLITTSLVYDRHIMGSAVIWILLIVSLTSNRFLLPESSLIFALYLNLKS